jgi:hypothetical protein
MDYFMNKAYNAFFFENPYPYKNAPNRIKKDSKFLQQFFGRTKEEVKTASSAYVGNSDGLRSFIFITRSYERLRSVELSEKATTLAVAIIIFAIDAVMMNFSKVPRPKKSRRKLDIHEYRLRQYLRLSLSRENKLLLLNSLVFGAIAAKAIPMRVGKDRHVMYRGMLRKSKKYNKRSFCTARESKDNIHCPCIEWLSSEDDTTLNYYLGQLAKHLYKMRCGIVHEGMTPLISHTEEKPTNYPVWGMTVSDIYFDSKNSRHYHYSSALSRKTFERIFISSLWTTFVKGHPLLHLHRKY